MPTPQSFPAVGCFPHKHLLVPAVHPPPSCSAVFSPQPKSLINTGPSGPVLAVQLLVYISRMAPPDEDQRPSRKCLKRPVKPVTSSTLFSPQKFSISLGHQDPGVLPVSYDAEHGAPSLGPASWSMHKKMQGHSISVCPSPLNLTWSCCK